MLGIPHIHCIEKFDLLDEKSYIEEREATIKSVTHMLIGLETLDYMD